MTITAESDIAGLLRNLDASLITGKVDNDPVTSFTDFSGNAGHGTGTGTYKTAVQNGLPCIRLNGSSDKFNVSLTDNATITVIVVMRKRSAASGTTQTAYGINDATAGPHHYGFQTSGGPNFIYYPTPAFGSVSVGAGGGNPQTAQITAQRYNSISSLDFWLDGQYVGNTDPEDNYPAFTSFYIGATPSNTEWCDLDVFQILIYDSALTNKQMYDLMSFLGNKWGVNGHAPNLISNRGTFTATAAGVATLTITNPTLIEVGSKLLLFIAVDNSGASGAAPGITSIVDSKGHTWTLVMTQNRTAASAANDGTTLYVYETTVTTAFVATNTVATTFTTGSPAAKSITLQEWARLGTIAVSALTGSGSGVGMTSPAITATAANQVAIGAMSSEGPNGDAYAGDTDTTNGWWQPVDRIGIGATTSGQTIATQYKRLTASGAQTYNSTNTSRDYAAGIVIYNPTAYPSSSPGVPKYKSGGSFATKPVKYKSGGSWTQKSLKIKVAGVWVTA